MPRNSTSAAISFADWRLVSIVDLNVEAVTTSFDGGEKRKPGAILNVYVLPASVGVGIATAASGIILDPAGAGLSGYVTRFAHVA